MISPRTPRKGLRKTPVKRVNRKRKNREWVRAYGSAERVEYVRASGCLVHGSNGHACAGEIENAHTVGGGMSRKADASTIVPLCAWHHRWLHTVGVETFQRSYHCDLTAAAKAVDEAYRDYVDGAA